MKNKNKIKRRKNQMQTQKLQKHKSVLFYFHKQNNTKKSTNKQKS